MKKVILMLGLIVLVCSFGLQAFAGDNFDNLDLTTHHISIDQLKLRDNTLVWNRIKLPVVVEKETAEGTNSEGESFTVITTKYDDGSQVTTYVTKKKDGTTEYLVLIDNADGSKRRISRGVDQEGRLLFMIEWIDNDGDGIWDSNIYQTIDYGAEHGPDLIGAEAEDKQKIKHMILEDSNNDGHYEKITNTTIYESDTKTISISEDFDDDGNRDEAMTTTFDSSGNVIKTELIVNIDDYGSPDRKTVAIYDEFGNITQTEISENFDNDIVYDLKTITVYDESGDTVEVWVYEDANDNGIQDKITIVKYHSDGTQTVTVHEGETIYLDSSLSESAWSKTTVTYPDGRKVITEYEIIDSGWQEIGNIWISINILKKTVTEILPDGTVIVTVYEDTNSDGDFDKKTVTTTSPDGEKTTREEKI